ncbi:MAG: N-acetylmuramoyl-L-alanine amidase [Burkholderiales bacterium]
MSEGSRRRFLRTVPGALLALDLPHAHGAGIVGVRIWPAPDYTRVTLELDESLKSSHFVMADPPRVVVDLEGVDIDAALREIVAKVQADDPYIATVRVAQNRAHVVRLVFDLKVPVSPQVFSLAPNGVYRHRLVLDLYPKTPIDPLAALIEQTRSSPAASALPTPASGTGTGPGDDPLAALIREREAALRMLAEPERPRPRGAEVSRLLTIAIDPGHGGEDPGAIGPNGTMEKDVVLNVALRLREKLQAEPGVRVLMTRDSDFFVPLATRVSKARAVSADLFVSVHADAFVLPHAKGSSVFVLSDRSASSLGARWLARRENSADLIGGVNLPAGNREVAKVLLDLSTTAQIKDSRKLASSVLGELRGIGDLHSAQIEQAGFAVLRAPDVPSILIETAFISNPDEERKLRDPRYQAQLADAIFVGIKHYFRRNPPAARGPGA